MSGRSLFFGYPVNAQSGQCNPNNFISQKAAGHFLTVAPAGAGKGVSLIIPNLLCYRGSAVVIDPNGELAWITAPRRRQLGQTVRILDPWDEVNRRYGSVAGVTEEIARFNPLSVLKPGSDDFIDNLAYLADAIIVTQSTKDPFWDDSARELWAGLMAYVVENPEYAPHASLSLVRKLLMRPNDELERIITTAPADFAGSVSALKLGQFKNPEKSASIASVIAVARTQTAFLDSPVLSERMDASDFSFDELREGGRQTTVYLVLPPHMLNTYARWLRLMVSIAIGTLLKGPLDDSERKLLAAKEPNPSLASGVESEQGKEFVRGPQRAARERGEGLPVLFLLDEFGTIGKLSAISTAFGLAAGTGTGITLWAFVQDLNQLKRYYPDEWETFIGNVNALVCFGIMDQFTVDYVSKMLGTGTDSPDEIRQMNRQKCIVIGHDAPAMCQRVDYFRDPTFSAWARPDPRGR